MFSRMYSTNAEHPGQPTRPPASAHFLVSSVDRYTDTFDRVLSPKTSAKWIMSKPYNLLYGYFTRLALTQLQFQWNLPTIIEGVNDEFGITIGGVTFTVVLTQGWYDLDALATAIEDAVTDADEYDEAWGFTCGVYEGALSLEADVVFTPFPGPPGDEAEVLNKFLVTAGLFVKTATLNPTTSKYVLVGGTAPMLYTKFIDICSQRLTQFQRVKDGTTLVNNPNADVIARVYACPPSATLNSGQPGQLFSEPWVMTIDYNTPKHIRWSPDQAINNFDIQLKDEFGDIITWNVKYPTEFQMTFLASET